MQTSPSPGRSGLCYSRNPRRAREFHSKLEFASWGGEPIFLSASEIQLGRGEPIKDTARVLGRMVRGVVFRTFSQSDLEEFARYSAIPTINALTDEEHPCQLLADIFTFEEKRGPIRGKVVAFLGDGACNVANSWAFAASKCGFELRIAAPKDSTLQRSYSNGLEGRSSSHLM